MFHVNQQLQASDQPSLLNWLLLWDQWAPDSAARYSEALSKQDRGHVNTILKVDLFTASLNPARNESSGHALRINSTDNLTFNLCPQRDNSSLPPYLGREASSSKKSLCSALKVWLFRILECLISPRGCCVKWQAKFYCKKIVSLIM